MASPKDKNRFHRIVGCVAAVGLYLFVGLPMLALVAMGECLPRETQEALACDASKRWEFFAVLLVAPFVAAMSGWLMYRLSKFLG